MATDEQLAAWGLDRLIARPPAPETEAVTRWRRVLAVEPAEPVDPTAEIIAAVAAEPFDLARHTAQRQALGLGQLGTDHQGHAHLDRWSR
jgi:hypothetical protein